VVIAIIALLVALLLPVLGSARKTADQIDCANRMRQSSIAVLFYVNDHKEVWPTQWGPMSAPDGQTVGGQEYRVAIAQYSGMFDAMNGFADFYAGNLSKNPMLCKASDAMAVEPTPGVWSVDPLRVYADWEVYYLTGPVVMSFFTINPFVGVMDTGYHTRRGFPKQPSLTMLLADGYGEPRPNFWYGGAHADNHTKGKSFFRFRHFEPGFRTNEGIMNMSYIDGHMKGWKWEIDGPIWPDNNGTGLWTDQPNDGFYWWNKQQTSMENFYSGVPYF
jgi:hypothetical protein